MAIQDLGDNVRRLMKLQDLTIPALAERIKMGPASRDGWLGTRLLELIFRPTRSRDKFNVETCAKPCIGTVRNKLTVKHQNLVTLIPRQSRSLRRRRRCIGR